MKNMRDIFQMFTVEIYLFTLTKPSKTLQLKWTSTSLDEHIIFVGAKRNIIQTSEFFVN